VKLVGYLRVSTLRQSEKFGPEVQRESITRDGPKQTGIASSIGSKMKSAVQANLPRGPVGSLPNNR
jgi:hypothetical protein